MGTIDNIFSSDNMHKYAEACVGFASSIPIDAVKDEIDTLVIPSRGAVPFFLGMMHALNKFQNHGAPYDTFYNNLGIHETIGPLLPSGIQVSHDVATKKFKVLLIPFTADLNVERVFNDENNDEYTEKTRQYWANFTAALFQGRRERICNPYFSTFTDVILRDIEGRDDVSASYKQFPPINKFAIMDTVISGRASNDILKAFDKLAREQKNPNLKPHAYLIVDANGNKLKHPFKSYLNTRKQTEGNVEYAFVPRIVSEDTNASLLGVGAVIYPTIMKASKNLTLNGKEFFVGAGSWRMTNELGEHNAHVDNFRQFMNVVYAGVDSVLYDGYIEGEMTPIEALERFERARESFVEEVGRRDMLNCHDGLEHVATLRNGYHNDMKYATGSSVYHLVLSDMSTRKAVNAILDSKAVQPVHFTSAD